VEKGGALLPKKRYLNLRGQNSCLEKKFPILLIVANRKREGSLFLYTLGGPGKKKGKPDGNFLAPRRRNKEGEGGRASTAPFALK